MNKKSIAKTTTTGKADQQSANRLKLARAIAEIQTNPLTPATLYNAVVDELSVIEAAHTQQAIPDPTYLAECLVAYEQRENERRQED